eukprot:151902-Ditylum_brightwellii.AAC.1
MNQDREEIFQDQIDVQWDLLVCKSGKEEIIQVISTFAKQKRRENIPVCMICHQPTTSSADVQNDSTFD